MHGNRLIHIYKIPLNPPLLKGEVITVKYGTPSFYKGGLGRIYAKYVLFYFEKDFLNKLALPSLRAFASLRTMKW